MARRSLQPRSRSDNNSSQQYPLVACRINVLLARNPLTCTNASLAEIDADIDIRSAHAHAAVATRRRIGYLRRGRRTCAVSQLGPFFAPLSTKLQLFQLPSAGWRAGFLGHRFPRPDVAIFEWLRNIGTVLLRSRLRSHIGLCNAPIWRPPAWSTLQGRVA